MFGWYLIGRMSGLDAPFAGKCQMFIGDTDRHGAPMLESSKQNLVRERIAHILLHHTSERTGAEDRVVALRRQPGSEAV